MIADIMRSRAGEPVEVLVQRGDGTELLTVIPRLPGEYDPASEGPIGVGLMGAPDGYDSGGRVFYGLVRGGAGFAGRCGHVVMSRA